MQDALIALRKKLNLTQQQFSDAVGVTMISVSRWETTRPPSGVSLAQLQRFARESGAMEIAQVFQQAGDEDRLKYFFPVIPSPELAVRELRIALHRNPSPARRRAYLAVLRALSRAHGTLLDQPHREDESADRVEWSDTQMNLEWLLKHEEKEGTK